MSCPTSDLAQTEETQEPQYKSVNKRQSATIDAPSILTETIETVHKDRWVTYGEGGLVPGHQGSDGLTPPKPQ